jgi:hypothetical protein
MLIQAPLDIRFGGEAEYQSRRRYGEYGLGWLCTILENGSNAPCSTRPTEVRSTATASSQKRS